MPALTVCAEAGCPGIAVKAGRCAKHQLPRRKGSTWRSRKQRARVLARDGYRCAICGGPLADSVDHVVRVRDGGQDIDSNLRAAHLRCNIKRG